MRPSPTENWLDPRNSKYAESLGIIYMYEQMREIDSRKKYHLKVIEIDPEQILPDTSYM